MMIFGVAYHVIPRFSGHPLWRRGLAVWHWWLANAGLALMVAGFAARVQSTLAPAIGGVLLGVGGTASAVGAYVFAYNVWRTIDGSVAVVRVARGPRRMASSASP